MRKLFKILIPAILLIAIVAACTVMFSSAAATGTPKISDGQTVMYIANVAKGTGDGSSADNAMGHGANYNALLNGTNAEKKTAYKQNVFYLAMKANDSAIVKNGGVLVICDEFTIDSSDSPRTYFAEFNWSTINGTKNITFTSYYDGVDYRTQGAKLVLDTSKYAINWHIKAPTTWEYLNIETKINSSRTSGTADDGVAMISFWGNKTIIDEQVVVTSNDVRTSGTKQALYPILCAYDRYIGWENNATTGMTTHVDNMNSDLTINSGTWSKVYGAVYGNGSYGNSTGVANITVNGGKIQQISGTGRIIDSTTMKTAHTGDVNITLNGGEVNEVYGSNVNGVGTGKINVTISDNVKGITKVEAYFATSSNSAKAPTNAVVTYDRSNVSDGAVKYFTTVNATGVAPEPGVIYVSANGTGNGSSPSKPLGNDPSYYTDLNNGTSGAYKKNAFYLAFQQLASTGGKVVLVGDVVIDSASSRVPTKEGEKLDPAEFTLPAVSGTVVVTSTHNGTNYGGKLILDHDRCKTTDLEIKSDITFENLEMVYKYDPDDRNNWGSNFIFEAGAKTLIMGEGIVVKSLNADTNKEGDKYPIVVGGHRYNNSSSTNVIVKSGTWDIVAAGGFGNAPGYPCNITGNAKLVIDGGKIGAVYGTGSQVRPYGTVAGSATITINGGEIDKLFFSNSVEYLGTGSVVTIGAAAKVNAAYYAVNGYKGDLEDLQTRVVFNNNTSVEVLPEPIRLPDVVYVSDNGTGDGSSPDKPLGTDAGYVVASKSYTKTAFYKAMEKLKEFGGYIVVVGDTAINSAGSRVEGKGQAPSELSLSALGGELIITSVYNGVDYRNNAKFILDQDACSVTYLTFNSDAKFENINIEHKYDPNDKNTWDTPMTIAANGNKLVIGKNVNVTAYDVVKKIAGNWYPAILGGHRYTDFDKSGNDRPLVANPDVTIMSGTWSEVYAGCYGMGKSYPGNVKGNATLNIMGGKIDAVYGTTSEKYASGKITGKLEINVTGGYVGAIFAAQKNGATNEIVVNIASTAERVIKVWGGVSDKTIPANATLNYDRSVTRDDEVKYWANVNVTGSVESQPAPYVYVVYVADVEKGLGDGSSPENAIGHGEGYAELRKKALAIIKANGGNNTGLTAEQKAITNNVYKQNALYRALSANGNKLVKQGGKLVVCGTLTIDSTDCMRMSSIADFWTPVGSETVTITSYDGTTNFRAKGAKLVLDNSVAPLCVEFGSPVILDNLTIVHKYNSKNGKGLSNVAMLAGRGNKFVIGYSVSVVPQDVNPDKDARVDLYPTLVGGHRYSNTKTDCYITVGSGQWAALVGGDWGSPHTGNATIGINGGKIGTVCGTINPSNGTKKNVFDGSVWIGLWAGEVDNVYVVGKPGMIWGDASIGLGGTKINGKVRATHPDYEGDDIQSWVFNYTNEQIDTKKIVGFENPVPETGSVLPYFAVVAAVSLVGVAALVISKKKKAVNN